LNIFEEVTETMCDGTRWTMPVERLQHHIASPPFDVAGVSTVLFIILFIYPQNRNPDIIYTTLGRKPCVKMQQIVQMQVISYIHNVGKW